MPGLLTPKAPSVCGHGAPTRSARLAGFALVLCSGLGAGLAGGAGEGDPALEEMSAVGAQMAAIRAAFGEDDFERTGALIDRLLAEPELSPDDRIWALHSRILLLHQAGRPCALVAAVDAYLAGAADEVEAAFDRRRARRRRAEAEAECAAAQRPAEPPPPPPPPPRMPPTGHGTLVAGSGALVLDHRRDAPRWGVVAAEASMGYLWPGGLQLDGAVLASLHAVVVRPGLRMRVGEPWSGAAVQLRLAGQVMLAGGADDTLVVGGGLMGGLGFLLELAEDFGLLTTAEVSLWPAGLHLAVDGRMGVYYAF